MPRTTAATGILAPKAHPYDHASFIDAATTIALLPKPGSRQANRTAINHWLHYCQAVGRGPFDPAAGDPLETPSGQGRLLDFLGWLLYTRPGVSPATADAYTSQVRSFLATCGVHLMRSPLHVQAVLRLRQHQPDPEQPPRQPATKPLIASIVTDPGVPLCIKAAIATAFELLMRSSEFCNPSRTTINPHKCLRRRHVLWRSEYNAFEVRLGRTKGDPFHLGPALYLFDRSADGDTLCAAALLRAYLDSTPHHHPDNPLWILPDGAYLTRQPAAAVLEHHASLVGLPPHLVKLHSLRIGGAFAMMCAGCPWPVIKAWGRWLTDQAAQLYTRMGDIATRRAASAAFTTFHDQASLPLISVLPR